MESSAPQTRDPELEFVARFEVEIVAGGADWLMRAVFVAAAVLDGRTVRYDAYRVT